MKNTGKISGSKAFQTVIILTVVLAITGCSLAGFTAANKYREEAATNYVFNVPAEKLLDETAAYLSGGGLLAAAGASATVDKANLTVTQPWRGSGATVKQRHVAQVTKVDDGRSTLVIMTESQTLSSVSREWESQKPVRSWSSEYQMIKRLDKQKAAEIEEGAKKAAADAKKK